MPTPLSWWCQWAQAVTELAHSLAGADNCKWSNPSPPSRLLACSFRLRYRLKVFYKSRDCGGASRVSAWGNTILMYPLGLYNRIQQDLLKGGYTPVWSPTFCNCHSWVIPRSGRPAGIVIVAPQECVYFHILKVATWGSGLWSSWSWC